MTATKTNAYLATKVGVCFENISQPCYNISRKQALFERVMLLTSELPYTSSIRNMPLMYSEMKRTALLLCEGKTPEEILQLSVEKNIYQLSAEKRRREVAFRMTKRLSTIKLPLIELLANDSSDETRLVAFLAFMKADRLLFEYMAEVYSEKYHAGFEEVADKNFLDFIDRKTQNCETVAKWSADILKNIRTKIKNTLITAELAKRTKDGFIIQKPLLCENLCTLLDENDRAYARAMLLEV